MGASHAKAYHGLADMEVVGLVARSATRRSPLAEELGGVAEYDDYDTALTQTKPDAVCIATYPDTHESFAVKAFNAGCHVFVEKPLAETVEKAQAVVDAAKAANKKLVVGYILRHHPSWIEFIKVAKTLGKPLVMRMNLNQQSSGNDWTWHKNLMNSLSPMVDCGVHYVDVMCQATGAKPTQVYAIGARLSEELAPGKYNYGQLQVRFDDGSVGWYEAGWGPMMSQEAFFVKDIVGPKGCVSIVKAKGDQELGDSSDIDSHTKTNCLQIHHAELDSDQNFTKEDEFINTADEPDHQGLCDREQAYFKKAILDDIDLSDHMRDAVSSLSIVLAADKSFREGKAIDL
ncbi:MAG: Gfo/Idh/MocA family oxidoreductase [Lentisphaeria bacterium]|nr:Gfo/Idh/MocA family oxidoreductase [Lentisphaeria bacterium]